MSECATETKQILTYKLKDCHDFPNVAFSFICFAFECHSKQSYRNKDLNVEAINSHFRKIYEYHLDLKDSFGTSVIQTPIISVCMVCRSHSYTHRLSMFITSITKCDLSIFRCMIDRNKQAGAISEGELLTLSGHQSSTLI